jgi:2-succinyl-6-hydroxy-2,4-cyclohexadiene-1-carboxylate synthase
MPYCGTIHYETWGVKKLPPVVFLHGFLGRGNEWREIANLIRSDCHSISIDLPGHGRSLEVKDRDYQISYCAKKVMSVLSKLNLKNCRLVGYSLGGRLALYMALHFPEKIKSLILESASPGLKTAGERKARVASDNQLAGQILTLPLPKFLDNWYKQPIFASIKNCPGRFQILLNERKINDPIGLSKSLQFMALARSLRFGEN